MLRGILFDLDETLLDINLFAFERRYMRKLVGLLADYAGVGFPRALKGTVSGIVALGKPHVPTNRTVVYDEIQRATGCDLSAPEPRALMEKFMLEDLPAWRTDEGPMPGTAEVLATCREKGLAVALATNPYFPLAVTRERMRWAGIDDYPFAVVTSWENSHAVKPQPAYYREVLGAMGLDADECLMVGNDVKYDVRADQVGLRTFHTGKEACRRATWTGDLFDLAEMIEGLAGARP